MVAIMAIMMVNFVIVVVVVVLFVAAKIFFYVSNEDASYESLIVDLGHFYSQDLDEDR